jgi:hypothetical protein
MRTRRLSALLFGLLLLELSPAVFADTVYLKNGRSFEGVLAEETGSQVRIRMAGGVLSLPRNQVVKVEQSESDLAEYLKRKEALQRGEQTGAADWLTLARWAKAQGLTTSAREAGLAAADIDPKLPGLAPLLRGFRYVYDQQLGRWISYEDSMRRRGFSQVNGVWMSREEVQMMARERAEEAAQYREAREAARTREAQTALATEVALLRETIRDTAPAPMSPYYPYGLPTVVVPGSFPWPSQGGHGGGHGGGGEGHGHGGHGPEPQPFPHTIPDGHDSFVRVPGSLIPGSYPTRSSSSSGGRH